MKKIIISLVLLSWIVPAFGQAKFNLSYQPDTKVYTVSIMPQSSWSSPMNITGSGQVILRVASDVAFTPAITSLVDGVIWADNAYIESQEQAPGYTFIAVAMVNGPTNKIKFTEGIEAPLFSFINAAGGCPGVVELTANDDPMVQSVIAKGFNITQHLAVLGARGNAYAGIGQGKVDCGLISGVSEKEPEQFSNISVAPLPADDQVTINWNRISDEPAACEMLIYSISGQLMYRQTVSATKGEHSQKIAVKTWKSGLYHLTFQDADGRHSAPHNLLVVH